MPHEWFAVRTMSGSQNPRREYIVETTSSKKGYRISPRINHAKSAIERALTEAGFSYYMPSEKRLIRDRRHTDLFKVRRFALLVGYVFVHLPNDFGRLKTVHGVRDVVGDAYGNAYGIDLLDILTLRKIEAAAELKFDDEVRNARRKARKNAKSDPYLKRLIDQLDIAGTMTLDPDYEFSNQSLVA